jgi:hypothetical protein
VLKLYETVNGIINCCCGEVWTPPWSEADGNLYNG